MTTNEDMRKTLDQIMELAAGLESRIHNMESGEALPEAVEVDRFAPIRSEKSASKFQGIRSVVDNQGRKAYRIQLSADYFPKGVSGKYLRGYWYDLEEASEARLAAHLAWLEGNLEDWIKENDPRSGAARALGMSPRVPTPSAAGVKVDQTSRRRGDGANYVEKGTRVGRISVGGSKLTTFRGPDDALYSAERVAECTNEAALRALRAAGVH